MPEDEVQVKQEDEPRPRPTLISVYLQKSKKAESRRFIGICSMDLSGDRVAQSMRVNFEDLISAQVVQRKGEETHWLLIVK
jgi:IMP cyclohydrolase